MVNLITIFAKINKLGKVVVSAAFCLAASTAVAVPITFRSFTGAFPYTENGFTVMPTQTPDNGAWGNGWFGGIGTRSGGAIGINSSGYLEYGTSTGTIEVTCANNGLFFFNSVELFGGIAEACNYNIIGMLNGSTIFSEGGGLDPWQPVPGYVTINGDPSLQIDSLFISLNTDPEYTTYFSIDDIDVAPVPDNSSTLLLFGIGASALMIFGRKQMLNHHRADSAFAADRCS